MHILAPTNHTGTLLASTDWARTPLGPMDGWPQSLRIAVSICMNSRFPMFVWWGDELINIYNDAYVPVLGQRHPRAFGRPALESWSDIWDVLQPQVEEVMERGRATWNERVLLLMERNGFQEETYFTWSYSPIYREDGKVGGLFCACTEETPRVQAERERDQLLQRSQETATTLTHWFDSAPGFVALLRGPDFVFEMVNRAYYQLVGHRPIQGKPLFEALPDTRNQGYEEILTSVYRSGEAFSGRGLRVAVQREPDGPLAEAFVDLVFQPVFDSPGQVAGIFVQGQDVTEQVLAVKALQEADRRKDEFLATLAHELRNPLAPIRQAAALSKAAQASPAQREWAQGVIERQTRHMALLLDDLLDVSRVSMGKLNLRMERLALATAVQSAVETAQPLIQAKGHDLVVDLPTEPIVLTADALRLAQVLTNLLSNAAKYTPEGGALRLTACTAGDHVQIRVRDNGIGLTPASRQEIFRMFSQVHSAIDRAEGGLGIGLALTRGLVELHGGTIAVDSEGPGRGAEFVVRLPWQPERTGDGPPPQASVPAPGALHAHRVVVADDNVDAAHSLAMLLEFDGHAVRTTYDGEEALREIEAFRPDAAILDIGMPRMNGYDVARRVRASPWGQQVLLIALTGWGQAHDQAKAREAGFDHHCTKPIDPASLAVLLGNAGAAGRSG